MKKIITLALLICISSTFIALEVKSQKRGYTKDEYSAKSKRHKKVRAIMVHAGLTFTNNHGKLQKRELRKQEKSYARSLGIRRSDLKKNGVRKGLHIGASAAAFGSVRFLSLRKHRKNSPGVKIKVGRVVARDKHFARTSSAAISVKVIL